MKSSAIRQDRLFADQPSIVVARPRSKAGRPRHDDESPRREVTFELNLSGRRFLSREARRLGISRDEVLRRAVRMLQVYSDTPAARLLDGPLNED
jgi:hypothetical protein